MNKKILTLCAIASIAVAVFSCSKKDDDSNSSTTSTTGTTATTSTTSTTSTTKPVKVYPVPAPGQMAIDTTLFNYKTYDCGQIVQGRYALTAHMEADTNNAFTSTWGKSPNFSNEFTITPNLPAINSSTQIQLVTELDNINYTAQSGKVKYFKNTDSSGIQFTEITFKGTNDSIVKMSGLIECP